jgi:pimeloyl-ACP methyl ester carboxylesterase
MSADGRDGQYGPATHHGDHEAGDHEAGDHKKHGHLRPPHPDDQAPPLPYFLTETPRAVAEFGLYLAFSPLRRALPAGDRAPVLVVPGLLADDTSTRRLRAELRRLGYWTYGWGLGRNTGPTTRAVNGLRRRLDMVAERHDRAVQLIGWSLGGIFARELARQRPEAIRQVITLGSPFRLAHRSQSRAQWAYNRYSHLHITNWQLPLESGHGPLPVPTTSIYSRYDGIVAWQSCLNPPSATAENIAVLGSHLGLGHHPAVIYAVADRLAQPEGHWSPFRPPAPLRYAFPTPDPYLPPGGTDSPDFAA